MGADAGRFRFVGSSLESSLIQSIVDDPEALRRLLSDNSPGQKAVLVTGASSGLGRAMTEMMASNGYFVYAGARKHKDMQELNASQKYSYDREALIEMLDKAMAEQ